MRNFTQSTFIIRGHGKTDRKEPKQSKYDTKSLMPGQSEQHIKTTQLSP